MHTLAAATTCRHTRLPITTCQATKFVDLTEQISAFVADTGLLLLDFQALLEELSPRDAPYRHDDASVRTGRQLLLGRWQRVFFVELDGPREREVSLLAFGEAWR